MRTGGGTPASGTPEIGTSPHATTRQERLGVVFGICLFTLFLALQAMAAAPREISGIYPSLAMFNNEEECGTGAVVPWAGSLWVVTYAPHKPKGSSDKLYEITPGLAQIIRPESIGGTTANRMIHRESNQLFIGPYVIDGRRDVRVIPYSKMFGRLTGNARHLFEPSKKIYYATMEEGIYEVDVHTLAVTELWADEQKKEGRHSNLPGYHGKGLYSGQGLLIYANNGDHAAEALTNPAAPSGALAQWDGRASEWTVARRNQFTDVTGPGGIYGNCHPARDPIWSIGWDFRSLILEVLDQGQWHAYRLPKASHSYDGAHGWNTEWPRIRDIGEKNLLMTMHGAFWKFPRSFRVANSAGLAPRSDYLKVIGDFCGWRDRVVFGCDDSARSEFMNKRLAKGNLAGPGRSQSNLWFVRHAQMDQFGPALGHGAVWLNDPVAANQPSDPYLFSGFALRGLHLAHDADEPVTFTLEIDGHGDGRWRKLRDVTVPAHGYVWTGFSSRERGAWIRLRAHQDCPHATAFFEYRNRDLRMTNAAPIFAGLAKEEERGTTDGLLHARGGNFKTLRFLAENKQGELGCYDLDGRLKLSKAQDAAGAAWMRQHVAIPTNVLTFDFASVIYTDDHHHRWRLPRGDVSAAAGFARERICREVCTERDLFNAAGTFYELPAENAGGFAKIRPIATHNLHIADYASYRGLLVMAGVKDRAAPGGHLVRSDDGKCTLWVGAVDDLWKMGKPRGIGGPWKATPVNAGQPSDPYLMTGYDQKELALSHSSREKVRFRLEADISGEGAWVPYKDFDVAAGQTLKYVFPEAFGAYWVRFVADKGTIATAQLEYK